MPAFLKALMRSRKFWLALFGVIQSIVFAALPNFPQEVWVAIDGLVVVLIGTIAAEDFATKVGGGTPGQ